VNDIVDEIVHNLEDGVKERGQKLEDFLRLQGMTLEKYREQARPIAEHQLKVRLVLIELAQQEGITVPDEEAQAEADRLTAAAAESDHTDALQGIFKSDSGQVRRQYDPLTSKTLARLRAIVTGQAPELPAAEAPAAEAPALEVAPPAEALAVAIEPGATAESPAEMPATDTAAVLEPLAAEAVPVVEQIE
jgi:trigger factor